jgi:hypothetical protein
VIPSVRPHYGPPSSIDPPISFFSSCCRAAEWDFPVQYCKVDKVELHNVPGQSGQNHNPGVALAHATISAAATLNNHDGHCHLLTERNIEIMLPSISGLTLSLCISYSVRFSVQIHKCTCGGAEACCNQHGKYRFLVDPRRTCLCTGTKQGSDVVQNFQKLI